MYFNAELIVRLLAPTSQDGNSASFIRRRVASALLFEASSSQESLLTYGRRPLMTIEKIVICQKVRGAEQTEEYSRMGPQL